MRIIFGVLKALCIVGGLPLTVVCLMAIIGVFTANGWLRLVPAVVVAVGLPLLLVDRLLPDERSERARGLPTDVLSLAWVIVPVVFAGALNGMTSQMLAVEGDRQAAAGWGSVAGVTYWMASVRPVAPPREANRDATTRAGTRAADAGVANASADASAAADATPADSRSADRRYTAAELFRRCSPSVVSIRVDKRRGQGGGTGFLIDDRGTIATNSHVIHDATAVKVKLKGGTWIRKVDLLMEDKEADLALLRVDVSSLPTALPLGDSDRVTVGEKVIAIGNPLGLEHTLTDGLVSARRIYRGRKWIQISVPISPGNSGGPLFNMKGEVVGVTTAGFSVWAGAQNLNLAVPINVLKKMLKDSYPDRRPVGADKPQTW